tara:strand:+ start:272 stop:853 length:582 start_codon:yes stop_codon:yes gene_type:complete
VTTEPLNPSVATDYSKRYAENTSGIIAAIVACIVAQGGSVASYPANTGGVIKALLDLKTAIGSGGGGGGGGGGGSADTVELSVTAGENLALGDVVYLHTDGKLRKADAGGTRAEAEVFGVVKTAASANASCTVVIRGKVTSVGAFSTAQQYWLSNQAGNIAVGPPGAGFITKVGMGIDANNLLVMIEPPVELT